VWVFLGVGFLGGCTPKNPLVHTQVSAPCNQSTSDVNNAKISRPMLLETTAVPSSQTRLDIWAALQNISQSVGLTIFYRWQNALIILNNITQALNYS